MIDILKANSDEVVEHYFEKIAADMSSVSDIVTILKALFVVIQGKPSAFMSMKIGCRYFKEVSYNKKDMQGFADKLQDKH